MPRKPFPRKPSPAIDPDEIPLLPKFRKLWATAPSLKPQAAQIEAAVDGQPDAIAIRDAWAFREPVTTLPREAYQALVAKYEGLLF